MGRIVAWAMDSESGLYGFISPDGAWVIRPSFDVCPGNFHDELAVIKRQRISNGVMLGCDCGFIDISGEIVIPISFPFLEGRSYFSNGLAIVGTEGSILAGYIDRNGKWQIEPRFYQPLPFKGKYTSAGNERSVYGVIDKNGNWHVEPRYAWLDNFYEGLACCNEHFSDENWDPKSGYVNEDGELVIELGSGDWSEFDSFSEGRAKLTNWRSNLSIYIDKSGFPVGRTAVLAGGYFYEGLAQALDPNTNGAGFLGLDGNWAISPVFYQVQDFYDGLAAAVASGNPASSRQMIGGQMYVATVAGANGPLWGFINKRGEWAIQPSYAGIRHFGAGYAAVRDADTGKWGVIDKGGRWVTRPRFEGIGHFHDTEGPDRD